ncbi:MAG: hypothetical protein ABIL58_05540 [Pseudomonadota bacterium]
MDAPSATLAFALADKIKSGLIWTSALVEQRLGLPPGEKAGAEKTLIQLMELIGGDLHVSKRRVPDPAWDTAEKELDLAIVMARSGVVMEATYHLTRALSHVTNVARAALEVLKKEGLM